ncbi:DNA-binding protein [Alkalimarinus alittae]|uniref:DNA-binding protein n=1 Tax=Alkalimarinus alittae TaxID=2961619 RepID=A0ABY6MXH4_9ALTE|nr:DNA-binding protein [Alkalimarinus alittae]UZE94528.1 DNA-binding protein [Alkalimarinus alittae]
MARGGVTYTDIANAAETIKNAGKNPTVDRVLSHLGTGSKSTIGPHLKNWKLQHTEVRESNDLPLDILNVVRELHQRLQLQADDKVQQTEQRIADLSAERDEEVKALENQIASLKQALNDTTEQRDALAAENKKLLKALNEADLNAVKLESKVKSDAQLISELTTSKNEGIHQIKLMHEQQEHYQLKMAEERTRERAESHAIKTQLNTQITEQSRQLAAADERYKDTRNEYKELLSVKAETDKTLQTLQCEYAKQETQITEISAQLEQSKNENQLLQSEGSKLNKLSITQSNQLAALSSELSLLNEALNMAKLDAEKIQDRFMLQTDEYQIVCQEKSVLQAQLKLLQESL